MQVLRSIRMNDRSTFPTAGHDFYRGQARTRTPYNPSMTMEEMVARQKQEAANTQVINLALKINSLTSGHKKIHV